MTTSITLRSTKGSALTHAEMDANLTNLQTTADAAKAATDTLTANKAEAAALGVANTDQNMGSFTGTTIADNVSAKVGMQSLETAVETKANATAVGVTSSAADMGTYTGTTIPDNETVKQNIQTLETAVEARPTSATLAATGGAALIGADDASSGAKYTTVQGFLTYLLSSAGSAIVGFIQAGTGAVARTVQAKMRDFVSVKDFGAVGDGVTDDTAAFVAALAAHKRLFIPAGTYLLDTIFLPTSTDGIEIHGSGAHNTILQSRTTNTPIFKKQQSAGVVQFSTFRDFSLKAHASGSTGTAFDCSGFRSCRWVNIRGLSNGSSGFASLFDVAGAPYKTYAVTWESCGVAEQTGWTKVWYFHNNGAGVLSNVNSARIIDPWIYANSGMSIAIDIANCTLYEISGGLIESSADYGIRLGSRGRISNIWLESQAIAPLQFQNTESVTSSNNLIEDVYISGFTGSMSIPSSCAGNTVINCSGTYTFAPTAGFINNFINSPQGGEPTLAYAAGPTGTLTKVEAVMVSNLNGMWRLNYTYAPSSSPGSTQFQFTPPTGYSIRHLIATALDNSTGAPLKCAIGVGIDDFWVEVASTNTIRLILQVAYQ